MINRFSFLFAVAGVALVSTTGCSGAEEGIKGEPTIEESEDELRSGTVLGEVAALRVENRGTQVTVAAPSKMTKLLRATGVSKKLTEGQVRCAPNPYAELISVDYLDAKGKVKGTATFACGGMAGELKTGGKSYLLSAKLDTVQKVTAEPLAVGDVLWGVSSVKIAIRGGSAVTLRDADAVAKAMAAVGLDQDPDAKKPLPKCPPSHSLTFSRGSEALGTINYVCGGAGNAKQQAVFYPTDEAVDARGAIYVNGKTFESLHAANQ